MSRGSQRFEFKREGDLITVCQRIVGPGRNGAARQRAKFTVNGRKEWPMDQLVAYIEDVSVRTEHKRL